MATVSTTSGRAVHASARREAQGARLSQSVLSGIVATFDVAAVVLTGLGMHLFYGLVRGSSGDLAANLAAIGLCALLLSLGARVAGLYRFNAIVAPIQSIPRLVVVGVLVCMVLALAAFALKVSAQFSRVWAFSWFLSAGLLTIGLRLQAAYALRRLARAGRIGRTIAVYGAGLQGARLIGRIDALNEPWNRIAGVFDDRLQRTGPVVGPYPMLGNLQSLVAWSRANLPDEILIALPWAAEERIHAILRTLAVLPANVRLSPEFVCSEFLNGRTSYQFGVPMLSAFEKPLTGWGAVWKRAFDLAASAVLLVALSPLLLLVAVLIKLESEGPVLFKQRRYGFNNELIGVLKFRTMSATATDPLGDRLTERKDPRITQVGVVLRRFSIDELPQLLNVLLGEMSVVGPRPHAIRTTAGGRQCDEVVGQYAVRHKVKPGITGWAQVNGWRGTMVDEEQLIRRVEHDLHYINNWSPMLDLKIIARTAWVVLTGRNSY